MIFLGDENAQRMEAMTKMASRMAWRFPSHGPGRGRTPVGKENAGLMACRGHIISNEIGRTGQTELAQHSSFARSA
ncbi:hypothetical protein D5687_03930 [Guyparkeria sp. SCN-R1]|nr:hypothetical protein D5687_03930 [Guyparkeria sp. SCN-R1]